MRLATSPRTSTASGIATRTAEPVGERRRAVARDHGAGLPALDHDGGLLRGDADPERPRCLVRRAGSRCRRGARRSRRGRRRPPAVRRAGRGSRPRWRRSPRTGRARRRPRRRGGPSESAWRRASSFASSKSAPDESELGPQRLDEVDLRVRRVLRREDDDAQPEALRRPGRRRAVVPGRRGDDAVGARLAVRGEDGQRSAPLEGAELVDVLALEPERRDRGRGSAAQAREGWGDRSREEAGRDCRTRPLRAHRRRAPPRACKVGSTARTGKSLPKTSRPAPQASRQSSSERGPYDAVSR